MKSLARSRPRPIALWALPFLMKCTVFAQTFNGQGGLLIPPGAPTQTVGITQSPCTVSGIGVLGGCAQIANVTINVNHTWTGDIAIFLIGPGGQILEFSSGNGGPGDNFTNTVFSDAAPVFITAGAPPFTGNFRPEGRQTSLVPPFPNTNPLGTYTFANTFNGTNADGDWMLYINDYVPGDVGVINSWSITFTGGGPGNVVTMNNPLPTLCAGATGNITILLQFINPTPAGVNYNVVISRSPGTPLTYNNIVPNGTNWGVNIPIPAVTTTYTLTSITANTGCQPTIGSPSSATVTIVPSPTAAVSGDLNICTGQNTELAATGGGTYSWSNGQTTEAITVMPAATQSYSVTVTSDVGGCTVTASAVVQVHPVPTVALTALPLICDGGCQTVTANLTGTAPFNFSYEFQSGGTFIGAGGFVGPGGGSIQFQACPPVDSGPTLQVVVCSLSDQNCSL